MRQILACFQVGVPLLQVLGMVYMAVKDRHHAPAAGNEVVIYG